MDKNDLKALLEELEINLLDLRGDVLAMQCLLHCGIDDAEFLRCHSGEVLYDCFHRMNESVDQHLRELLSLSQRVVTQAVAP